MDNNEGHALILVDEDDLVVGSVDKSYGHRHPHYLHRAYSIFIFDEDFNVLVQRRSHEKPLWGGYWSNSCCSHPKVGESILEGAGKRLKEELGFTTQLRYLYKFRYFEPFLDVGFENEICYVLCGTYDGRLRPNSHEVIETEWVPMSRLLGFLDKNKCTPWFQEEAKEIYRMHQEGRL